MQINYKLNSKPYDYLHLIIVALNYIFLLIRSKVIQKNRCLKLLKYSAYLSQSFELRFGRYALCNTTYVLLSSWWIRHTFFVRFIRGFLSINNIGTHPPPILRLSDGGHFENLALLPLLDKKLKKIVIFDGSCNPGDEKYAESLLTALELAREKLHCSFVGMSGRDINEDIRVEFLKMKSKQRPRSYRFKVQYYDQVDTKPISDGEILFVAPRHPCESIPLRPETGQPKPWKDFDMPLEADKWGDSPELTDLEADRLTFCCCTCCHRYSSSCCSCRCISERLLGKFPHHITANQFFTPDTFSAYHREGYAACVEAGVAGFLEPQSPQNS